MSGDNGKHKPELVVTAIWNYETGAWQVFGPMIEEGSNIFDEPHCVWMLDKAKDIIKLHNKKVKASSVLTPKKELTDAKGNRLG